MDYIIVESVGMEKLVAKVNEYIKKGWKPIGGVAVGVSSGPWWYFQAMIKE